MVWRKDFGTLPEGTHQLDISTLELPSYPYLLRIVTDFGFQSRKVQVQR
ncbi:MAG: hypothetical protein H6559_34245 [Lewinellaceae bacterium]|nr:hypothetical protein [Lewinellaceae bacterium]